MTIRVVATLVLSAVAAAAAADEKSAPLALHLQAIDPEVVKGVTVAKVEEALRGRLGREKSLALVPRAEDATVVLEVTECLVWTEKRRVTDRPLNIPTQGRGSPGPEPAYETRTERRKQVSLVVRATWSERFEDLQSGDADRTLKDAAGSVADALARILKGTRPTP